MLSLTFCSVSQSLYSVTLPYWLGCAWLWNGCTSIVCTCVPAFLCLHFLIFSCSKSILLYRELYSNNISGRIPEELGNLTNLVSLDLYLNNLTGPIPNTLSKLGKLRFLYEHESLSSSSSKFISFFLALQFWPYVSWCMHAIYQLENGSLLFFDGIFLNLDSGFWLLHYFIE